MKTKIQIKSCSGKVLFEYSCKDNTVKKTLEKGYLESANLIGADLRGAEGIKNIYQNDKRKRRKR